jgi:hypothetical protein
LPSVLGALDVALSHLTPHLLVQPLEERQGIGLEIAEYRQSIATSILRAWHFLRDHLVTGCAQHRADFEMPHDAVRVRYVDRLNGVLSSATPIRSAISSWKQTKQRSLPPVTLIVCSGRSPWPHRPHLLVIRVSPRN